MVTTSSSDRFEDSFVVFVLSMPKRQREEMMNRQIFKSETHEQDGSNPARFIHYNVTITTDEIPGIQNGEFFYRMDWFMDGPYARFYRSPVDERPNFCFSLKVCFEPETFEETQS